MTKQAGQHSTSPPRPAWSLLVQCVGYAIGITLLVWCIRLAFSGTNREQLATLQSAPWSSLALLFALSLVSIGVNGVLFWIAILPRRSLPLIEVLWTNALATLLNYLPFKLSVASRVLVHARKHDVGLPTIGAWFASVGAVLLGTLVPFGAVCRFRQSVDATSLTLGMLCVVGVLGSMVVVFRLIRARLPQTVTRQENPHLAGLGIRLTGDGARDLASILGSPWHVGIGAALRCADLVILASRMYVAANLLGVELRPEHALFLASGHFLTGVLSPFGMVGTREAATVGLASAIGIANAESVAPIPLLIGASELPVLLALCPGAIYFLRFDRLIAMRKPIPLQPEGGCPTDGAA